jgi:hypothetical protein
MMNEQSQCTICGKTTQHMACSQCERAMHRQLGEILDFVALAEANLVPGCGAGGRGTERPIGIRVDALDLVAGFDVLPQLESWERLFREDYNLTKYGEVSGHRATVVMVRMPAHDGATIPPLVAISGYMSGTVIFLQQWLPRICDDHAAVDEFAYELRQLHRQAQAASGQSPRNSWNVACPSDTDDGECGNRLKVNGEDFDGQVSCRKCQTTWPVQRLLLVAASSTSSAIMLDAEAAARMYNVSTKTLHRWAKAGRITKDHGRYDIRQIQQALAQ